MLLYVISLTNSLFLTWVLQQASALIVAVIIKKVLRLFLFGSCTRVTRFSLLYRWSMYWNFNRNSRDLCASWNLADCSVSKSAPKPYHQILFLIIIAGYHGNCQDPVQAIKARKAILTFSLLSFSPPIDSVIMIHTCSLSVPLSFFLFFFFFFVCSHGSKGTASLFFSSYESHSCKMSGFYHDQPAVCSGRLAGKRALLSVTNQSGHEGGLVL